LYINIKYIHSLDGDANRAVVAICDTKQLILWIYLYLYDLVSIQPPRGHNTRSSPYVTLIRPSSPLWGLSDPGPGVHGFIEEWATLDDQAAIWIP